MATMNNALFLPSNKFDPFKEKKHAQVDYDAGTHRIYTRIPGLRKLDLPKRQRLRVDGDRFQKDWTLSEVVERITKLKHWEDVEGVLNQWAGRFARKNFPVLMKVISQKVIQNLMTLLLLNHIVANSTIFTRDRLILSYCRFCILWTFDIWWEDSTQEYVDGKFG